MFVPTEQILGEDSSSRGLWGTGMGIGKAPGTFGQRSQEGFLGYPVQGQGLDWMILVDPFQLGMFWDPVITNGIMQRRERPRPA